MSGRLSCEMDTAHVRDRGNPLRPQPELQHLSFADGLAGRRPYATRDGSQHRVDRTSFETHDWRQAAVRSRDDVLLLHVLDHRLVSLEDVRVVFDLRRESVAR